MEILTQILSKLNELHLRIFRRAADHLCHTNKKKLDKLYEKRAILSDPSEITLINDEISRTIMVIVHLEGIKKELK